jgi:hypothetical protein
MRNVLTITAAVLLATGVAFAEEQTLQQNKEVKEKTTHSTTVDPTSPGQPVMHEHESKKIEKHQQATTATNPNVVMSPEAKQKEVEVKKQSSTTVTTEGENTPASDQDAQSRVQSESHYKQSSKSVTEMKGE